MISGLSGLIQQAAEDSSFKIGIWVEFHFILLFYFIQIFFFAIVGFVWCEALCDFKRR